MENNRVSVKIYGQEYVITGDIPKDEILRHASRVDDKMHEIGDAIGSAAASPQDVAILAAVNICSEQAQILEEIEELRSMNIRLEKDAQHYVQLWDESNNSYADYKEETQAIVDQKEDLLQQIDEKDKEIQRLTDELEDAKASVAGGMDDAIREVEEKCCELENSFFDIQMENLQLKKELDKYKTDTGQF